jgi:hypothetical protein
MTKSLFSFLVTELTTSYGDYGLDPPIAERTLIRALAFLNADLRQEYEASGDPKMIKPEINSFHRELLLLRALAYLVRIKRRNAASASVSFKSGERLITCTTSNWMKLERDILTEYWRRIKGEAP